MDGTLGLALVSFASLAASAWWESRDGDPLTALGLSVAPFVGLASVAVFELLFGSATTTVGYPLQVLLFVGLLLGAGGYAFGILWGDVTSDLPSHS